LATRIGRAPLFGDPKSTPSPRKTSGAGGAAGHPNGGEGPSSRRIREGRSRGKGRGPTARGSGRRSPFCIYRPQKVGRGSDPAHLRRAAPTRPSQWSRFAWSCSLISSSRPVRLNRRTAVAAYRYGLNPNRYNRSNSNFKLK
jgi:hypothetical protein